MPLTDEDRQKLDRRVARDSRNGFGTPQAAAAISSSQSSNSRSDSPISVRKYNPALDSPNSSSILVKTHSNMQSMIDKYKITPNYIIKNQITIGVTSKGKLRKIATDFYILFHSQDVLEES